MQRLLAQIRYHGTDHMYRVSHVEDVIPPGAMSWLDRHGITPLSGSWIDRDARVCTVTVYAHMSPGLYTLYQLRFDIISLDVPAGAR